MLNGYEVIFFMNMATMFDSLMHRTYQSEEMYLNFGTFLGNLTKYIVYCIKSVTLDDH